MTRLCAVQIAMNTTEFRINFYKRCVQRETQFARPSAGNRITPNFYQIIGRVSAHRNQQIEPNQIRKDLIEELVPKRNSSKKSQARNPFLFNLV
jgi:hypothetical protein